MYAKDEFGEYLLGFGSNLLSSDIINIAKSVSGVISASILTPTPVSNQVLISVGSDEILTNTGSSISINMIPLESSDLAGSKRDKYLFQNPRNLNR
jgi:hypothetical protein